VSGPYQTERQAREASLWATDGHRYGMSISAANLADLAAALSGVELGDYDRRIVEWLAGFEPSTVAVISSLIQRARGEDSACRRCGQPKPDDGNDMHPECEEAEGADALAALQELAAAKAAAEDGQAHSPVDGGQRAEVVRHDVGWISGPSISPNPEEAGR
jgi:hypothetical protein